MSNLDPNRQAYNTVRFGPLYGNPGPGATLGSSMDILRDIRLHLTVELGRTSLPLKQLLQMGEGSVVELDQLAGEPVTILAAGKVVAQGEVVVIGSNYGVKILKIFQAELSAAALG